MNIRDKKNFLLQKLTQEEGPVEVRMLLKKMGEDYAGRSVRRWVSELIEEGAVEKLGRKRRAKYQAKTSRKRSLFGLESTLLIDQVKRPLYERKPTAYEDQWFDSYQPNSTTSP